MNNMHDLKRRSNRKKISKKGKNPIIYGVIALVVVAVVLLFVFLFGGDALKGTWDMDGVTVYQFEGNGKGAMILPSNTYAFSYTINEDKTVSIDFEDEKATDYTYNYEVKDDTLVLSGSEGKESFEYNFTKQK